MILFEKAYNIVMDSAFFSGSEHIDIINSLNRVLAQDILSDMDMPPFDKSAVDGYACRKEDLNNELEIIEIISAGKAPEKTILKNQCSKIMTGAMMPKGADSAIMIEDTEIIDNKKIKYLKDKVKVNICYKGEDFKSGVIVLKKGTVIKPQHIAVLASVGCARPLVSKKIKVAIIPTGDELVEPKEKPTISQIRNSNAYLLLSNVEKISAIPNYVGIAKDSKESIFKMISKALSDNNDIILLTGGVSMGDYDYVPEIMKKLNIKILFDSIATQPGRPTVFGVRENQFIFGLPGNPVSSFVQFELLVKPLIYKMMGHNYKPLNIKLPMGIEYNRKRSTRKSWLPVYINEQGRIIPLDYHGSAHINAFTSADGLISIPIGETTLKKGEIVNVRQI
ncbi:MAG: molybdopterin molybdotransferase MoeA [Bacteroidales bacterium]|nr:molybdopterin molybdotransferase MoeA [Bacteroidales bacterium]